MSAYAEWLQKQERKVRRPVTSPQAPAYVPRAPITVPAAYEMDLADSSDAYKAWLQRREARLAAVEQVVASDTASSVTAAANRETVSDPPRAVAAVEQAALKDPPRRLGMLDPVAGKVPPRRLGMVDDVADEDPPRRNSKEIIADAVNKYTLLAKVAAESKKRPLPKTSSASFATASTKPAAIPAPTTITAKPAVDPQPTVSRPKVSVAAKPQERKSSSSSTTTTTTTSNSSSSTHNASFWEKLIGDAGTHRRKRGIGDVEAPSKRSTGPLKQKRKVRAEAKHEDNSSSSSSDSISSYEADETGITKKVKKKATSLDEALAKIDAKYGALVSLEDYTSTIRDAGYLSDELERIEEVQYWNEVDRFASLS